MEPGNPWASFVLVHTSCAFRLCTLHLVTSDFQYFYRLLLIIRTSVWMLSTPRCRLRIRVWDFIGYLELTTITVSYVEVLSPNFVESCAHITFAISGEVLTYTCFDRKYWRPIVFHDLACFAITLYDLNASKFALFDCFEISKYSYRKQQTVTLTYNSMLLLYAYLMLLCTWLKVIVEILTLSILTLLFFTNHNMPQRPNVPTLRLYNSISSSSHVYWATHESWMLDLVLM